MRIAWVGAEAGAESGADADRVGRASACSTGPALVPAVVGWLGAFLMLLPPLVKEGMDIYLLGICGTGVGALAGMLKSMGHRVRGSDEHIYPPMSDKLNEWGIGVLCSYDAAHLRDHPDLVIIGNVIRRDNPEAVYARDNELPTMSMPEAVATFGIGDKHSIVFAGTHGKTTTSAMAAHILMATGKDPAFLVGGAMVGYGDSFRLGAGPCFVIEGDEYDTAYFDKGPKFWHYRPRTAVITSLEFDHADIFADMAAVEQAFAGLIERVPNEKSGHLVIWQGAERALRLAHELADQRTVTTYAIAASSGADLVAACWSSDATGITLEPVLRGKFLGPMRVPQWGEFSALNTLAVIAALNTVDATADELRQGLASFAGVKRRMEVLGEPGGITLVDDFAHHPTALLETLRGARSRFANRRLWAVFEPRSATNRRNIHHAETVAALAVADLVVVASHARLAEVPLAERFLPDQVAADITRAGTPAVAIPDTDAIVAHLAQATEPGDVVMICSNGAFGGLHHKLAAVLAEGERDGKTEPRGRS